LKAFNQIWFYLGLIWVSLIAYLSLTTATPMPINLWDKAQHFLAYGFLGFWFLCISYDKKTAYKYAIGIFTLGIILELLQSLVPGRYPSLLDVIANSLGVILAFALKAYIFRIRDFVLAIGQKT